MVHKNRFRVHRVAGPVFYPYGRNASLQSSFPQRREAATGPNRWPFYPICRRASFPRHGSNDRRMPRRRQSPSIGARRRKAIQGGPLSAQRRYPSLCHTLFPVYLTPTERTRIRSARALDEPRRISSREKAALFFTPGGRYAIMDTARYAIDSLVNRLCPSFALPQTPHDFSPRRSPICH